MVANINEDDSIKKYLEEQTKWAESLNSTSMFVENINKIKSALDSQSEWIKGLKVQSLLPSTVLELQESLKAQTEWMKGLNPANIYPASIEAWVKKNHNLVNYANAPALLSSAQKRQDAIINGNTLTISTSEGDSCKVFDKHICLANIRELLKNTEIKIGQLEKEAGTQLGYMSRLEKKENTTQPSLDFILTASRMLKVSLDVLLTVPLTELSPTAAYIVKLLDKLMKDTYECKLDWEKKSASCLNGMDSDMDGNVSHPLFVDTRFNDYGQFDANSGVGVVFNSNYYGVDSIIDGDCFSLELKGNATLFLMRVSRRSDADGASSSSEKELWISKNNKRQFLTGSRDIPCIKELTEKLFVAVDYTMQHPKLNNDIKASLDAFLVDDFGDNEEVIKDDGIPF